MRTIYLHELAVGDMIRTVDGVLYVLKCTPDSIAPDRLRVIKVFSSWEDKFFNYDDMSGPGHRCGMFPFVQGEFLYRHTVQSDQTTV